MMEEVKEVTSTLSVHGENIKVTEVLKDGDTLTFLIVSQKRSGTGEHHVDRTYDDFEWLQQLLFSPEDEPGIQGVISCHSACLLEYYRKKCLLMDVEKFPSLPAKAHMNPSAKIMKQLGFLGLGEWLYSKALESYLRQVAAHSILSKNKAVEIFLTSSEPPGRQRARKNLFNRLSQAVEERRKEGYKDVDEFFQTERNHNLVLTGYAKTAAERFLGVVQSEQKIAVACAHFSASLHLCVEPGEDPDKQAFSKACVKLSEVFDSIKKNMTSVAENNMNTLGLGLDLESRCQEAEKEMLFRRICKLVELEAARRNAEKAKPLKKAAMEEAMKTVEMEFNHICVVAKQEVHRFRAARVKMLQHTLVQWGEKQLLTANESADQFNQQLQAFRGTAQ